MRLPSPGLRRSASRRWRPAPAKVPPWASLMAMDPRRRPGWSSRARHVREPAFGLPRHLDSTTSLREEATFRGYTIGRSGDRADHAPDRDPQGETCRNLLLLRRRSQESLPEGTCQPSQEENWFEDLVPSDRLGDHHPARAAGPAGAEGGVLDPPTCRPILERPIGEAAPHTASVTMLVEQWARQVGPAALVRPTAPG